ncbi:hypothetical protein DYU05_14140 [Mucilaginibacter terrenus]|uniref:Uncharacterized protein n=1 Tax=Mucilaginibacter terrenus TaxID=2482727 RepID=A0A3E2NQL8_9SPHI|nr:hypothetical protein [Mucilaginibacter terrenus]RFZ83273.1 hypothetical protein DYU05_14140 [Mucilaginibacter terrenus]
MTASALIFWAIFVLPLIAFMIWLMRQDKRSGKLGLIVLLLLVAGVIVYMYLHKQFDTSAVITE